ncbi:related to OPA3-like protein [Saccharomycodes ludwigii]|uniref:Related to OPA3-like protein n=1 Tax=Saccharomycodes ludwigii TaxID=36035 RepID=A0A376BB47_9ASCO|nr:related to OPA3-like protein [Saccharomycodes ludwigii]
MSGAITIKLLALALRQVSRPIANIIKAQAKQHETFKKLCISFAQRMHKTDLAIKAKLTSTKHKGTGNNIKIKSVVRPLNDEKAVENGATILSELFVFSVAGGIVAFETIRQMKKESARREAVTNDIGILQEEIEDLKKQLKLQGEKNSLILSRINSEKRKEN